MGAAPQRPPEELARRIASLAASLATGASVWAKHASDVAIASEARAIADEQRVAAEEARAVAAASRPGVRTCERLRWEWLLSTAVLLDGGAGPRLRTECLRLIDEAERAACILARSAGPSPRIVRIRALLATSRERLLRMAPDEPARAWATA
jgi:hypothetical protein